MHFYNIIMEIILSCSNLYLVRSDCKHRLAASKSSDAFLLNQCLRTVTKAVILNCLLLLPPAASTCALTCCKRSSGQQAEAHLLAQAAGSRPGQSTVPKSQTVKRPQQPHPDVRASLTNSLRLKWRPPLHKARQQRHNRMRHGKQRTKPRERPIRNRYAQCTARV